MFFEYLKRILVHRIQVTYLSCFSCFRFNIMAEDFDVEAMLEAPYNKGVSHYFWLHFKKFYHLVPKLFDIKNNLLPRKFKECCQLKLLHLIMWIISIKSLDISFKNVWVTEIVPLIRLHSNFCFLYHIDNFIHLPILINFVVFGFII